MTKNKKNKREPSLPIAGSFKALYLSLRASGVRVRRRSSLPMICNTVNEKTLKVQNVY